ncbi:MAG: hypothetical protein L3J05_07855 [Robiginitomaculum sp.]|nr:hypothetical protein [Robiginitomaculum sp.]
MRNRFAHRLSVTTLLGVFALGTVSACGIKGELKTPPPIWGDKAQTEKTQAEKTEMDQQDSETSAPNKP